MKKRIFATILAAIAAVSLAACGQSKPASDNSVASTANTSDATPADGGNFVYGLATEVDNFDPFTATTADAKSIYFNIYEGLVKVNPDGTFSGAVASDYQISDDAKTYTFTLRDGVKFHNGAVVTTDDVLYSIQHAIDSGIPGYDNVDSFEATDDKTIVVTLKKGDADFLAIASQAIIPKDSDNKGELALAPIGTGPYKFASYAVQDHVTLDKNPDYWGTPAHLNEIIIRFIASSSDLLVNYQSGAIDGFTANAAISEQVDKNSSTINVGHSNAVQALYLNNANAPFDDVRVRQALSYAVDSEGVINTVDYGYGTEIGTAMIPGLSSFFNDDVTHAYDVDVKKAKHLLSDAGYPNGFSFTVKVPSNYQVHLDSAQVLVNQLAKAGITMDIQQVDWATWLENVYTNRDYDATIISVDGSIASPTAFLSRYVSDAHNNFVNFNSKDYDAAYAKATAAVDQEKRVAGFKECQKILSDEAASVYIQDIANNFVYSTKFAGYTGYPLYAVDFASVYRIQ